MRRFVFVMLIVVTVLPVTCTVAGDYSMKSFKAAYKALEEDAPIVNLCRDYMEHAEDVDVVREAQNKWRQVDPDGIRDYCREKSQSHPEAARHKYLLGRVTEDPVEQIRLGRQAIMLEPQWPYGYRLVLATYVNDLLEADEEGENHQQLLAMLEEDGPLFEALVKLEPGQDYALEFQFGYLIYQGRWDEALKTLEAGEKAEGSWPSGLDRGNLQARMGQYEEALKSIEEEIDYRIAERGWPEEDRDKHIATYYQRALIDAKAYQAGLDYLSSTGSDDSDGAVTYDMACLYALMKDNDKAFEYLAMAGEKGYSLVGHAREDSDLSELRQDPRWADVIGSFRSNWDKGRPQRKEAALADKLDKEAPAWSLIDAAGNTVNLADLRGKVVVLDFWARWCSWCIKAMPMIDDFTENHTGEDVRVFSVNVWEKGKAMSKEFMAENGYDMTLLYGTNDLATAYGINGIPYLCVIDKNGSIRYEESGYSDGLLENLIWWTEALQE
ncbi:MAG: redoxin family protein [bacterium]